MPDSCESEHERGETLLELVVAIVILGVCVVSIGTGIAISIKMSNIHREQAIAQQFLHNYAETIQNSYTDCSGSPLSPPNYAGALVRPDDGGNWGIPTQSQFGSWSGTAFQSGCPTGTDFGLQQVTLNLKSTDGFVDESLVVVIRKMT